MTAPFYVYDRDGLSSARQAGNQVKGTVGGVTTIYIGNYFEWRESTSTMVKYYYAGSIRIAMRTGYGSGTSGLLWLFERLNVGRFERSLFAYS